MFRWAIGLILAAGTALAAEDEPGPYLTVEVDGEATGSIVIDLFAQNAPNHVEQIIALAENGVYDDVAFHRVIEGFMAQTGDVEFGRASDYTINAGRGGSNLPDLKAEFSDIPYDRGIVGMARSRHPDSANSQFFIMFAPAYGLNGQYTVIGRVVEGMEVVDAIKRGDNRQNGVVASDPDRMAKVTVSQ